MPQGPDVTPVDRYLIRLEVFEAWTLRVERRNEGKVGAPFRYPVELFRFLAWARARSSLDYRGLGELAKELLDQAASQLRSQRMPEEMLARLQTPHFTQIRRRVEEVSIPDSVRERLLTPAPMHIVLDTNGVRTLSPPEFQRWVMKQSTGRGFASATRPSPVQVQLAQLSNVASTAASALRPAKS